jgi:hypothetical protein
MARLAGAPSAVFRRTYFRPVFRRAQAAFIRRDISARCAAVNFRRRRRIAGFATCLLAVRSAEKVPSSAARAARNAESCLSVSVIDRSRARAMSLVMATNLARGVAVKPHR